MGDSYGRQQRQAIQPAQKTAFLTPRPLSTTPVQGARPAVPEPLAAPSPACAPTWQHSCQAAKPVVPTNAAPRKPAPKGWRGVRGTARAHVHRAETPVSAPQIGGLLPRPPCKGRNAASVGWSSRRGVATQGQQPWGRAIALRGPDSTGRWQRGGARGKGGEAVGVAAAPSAALPQGERRGLHGDKTGWCPGDTWTPPRLPMGAGLEVCHARAGWYAGFPSRAAARQGGWRGGSLVPRAGAAGRPHTTGPHSALPRQEQKWAGRVPGTVQRGVLSAPVT